MKSASDVWAARQSMQQQEADEKRKQELHEQKIRHNEEIHQARLKAIKSPKPTAKPTPKPKV